MTYTGQGPNKIKQEVANTRVRHANLTEQKEKRATTETGHRNTHRDTNMDTRLISTGDRGHGTET